MAEITGYHQINLRMMINELGEDKVKTILSEFSCPLDRDVEDFVRYKAIEFSKQGIAATHLVFTSYQGAPTLVGIYALANKNFVIKRSQIDSSRWRKRLNKFATYDHQTKQYFIPLPLIGQLAKNYANEYNMLITGDELLKMACDRIQSMQMEFGGRMAYLECKDEPKLIKFYNENGFERFMNRQLDREEREKGKVDYYVQMLRYFK